MDQPKLDRLLRIMKMLTGNNQYTLKQLASRFETSPRTIYRYIDTFREAGFVIKSRNSIYRIDKSSPYFKDISSLIHFTEEEAWILKAAIESIDETNLIKQNLKKKLYTIYDYKILADAVVKGKDSININRLIQAVEEKRQVVLRSYSSANSNEVSDRLAEPFRFTTNYIQLWAFEHKSRRNKLFKISRIGEVELLDQSWQYEQEHVAGKMDVFRLSSDVTTEVDMVMNLRAANLLREEYPLAEKFMKRIDDNHWQFNTWVCGFEGIGRFVAGLSGEIISLWPPGLMQFVQQKSEALAGIVVDNKRSVKDKDKNLQ